MASAPELRARALLEEAATLIGLGRFPSTLEAVFDRGGRLHDVFVKQRVPAGELDALADDLLERARASARPL